MNISITVFREKCTYKNLITENNDSPIYSVAFCANCKFKTSSITVSSLNAIVIEFMIFVPLRLKPKNISAASLRSECLYYEMT